MRRVNGFDAAVVTTVIFCVLGFAMAKAGHAGVDNVIEGKVRVSIDVYLIGLKTLDPEIFKTGETSAITIRNRPVEPPMKISKVDHWQHKASFLAPDGKSAVAFPDPAVPVAHDYIVTVEENAERTADGYVVSGNKIKIGNQVDLEGFKYRASGVVVNVNEVSTEGAGTPTPGSGG
ncbi:MAG: DUF4330 domain-containing protein [Candidatus Obscuribacterales bacterium]|nr:DUF4330 domain-containing protein [Candidatus Obscuribacterales bacterium]